MVQLGLLYKRVKMSYSPNFRGSEATSIDRAATTGSLVTNSTGVSLDKLTPVQLNSSGLISAIDVSLDSAIAIAGVLAEHVPNGSTGSMVSAGTIKDISSSFNLGDTLYISKTGTLTSTKPSIGIDGFVEGDYAVRIGVVGKNEDNSLLLDLHLSIDVVGQL